MFWACDDVKNPDEPDTPEEKSGSVTFLVYGVASNNLRSSFDSDIAEMKRGLLASEYGDASVLVYEARDHFVSGTGYQRSNPLLCRYYKSGDKILKEVLKEYTADEASTDGARLRMVVEDAKSLSPQRVAGVIFWSHALGWSPAKSFDESARNLPKRSFGLDIDKRMDIDELASALPDFSFDYIWMDCCYMGSIEVAYQLRRKSTYFIAYPTEVLSDGAPYDRIVPFLLQPKPAVTEAAKAMFAFYDAFKDYRRSATMTVLRTECLSALADASRKVLREFSPVNAEGLQIYSRKGAGPFYDFGDYLSRVAETTGTISSLPDFDDALSNTIIYKAATPDFLLYQGGFNISEESFSGLSTHVFTDGNGAEEEFYRGLDWYREVYPQK